MGAFTTQTENDRHAKRIIDDAAMWQERLEQLAELRRHASIPDRDALAGASPNTSAS
jgi:hypothetical protein